MLMQTFLQMSQRYVLVTVEWQRRGKNKKKESNAQKKIKSSAPWLPSLTYNKPLEKNIA